VPGNDFGGHFDHFDSYKVLFPLLISNLSRKDMKHFVVEKPQGCKWKICLMEFTIPRFRTEKYGKHSFTYLGPKLCNKLPSEIRTLPSLLSFKNRIRKFDLRQDIFELRALCRQKDHNNLLPPVKFSWNHMCFAPGNDFGGCFDHFDSYKVLFPLLISNLSRKDMKHFVVEKPQGCKWKICFGRLAMRCEQCWPFVRKVMADSDGLRRLTFDTFLPNQFIKGM